MRWNRGRATIDKLIADGELQRVPPSREHADQLLAQASALARRLARLKGFARQNDQQLMRMHAARQIIRIDDDGTGPRNVRHVGHAERRLQGEAPMRRRLERQRLCPRQIKGLRVETVRHAPMVGLAEIVQ